MSLTCSAQTYTFQEMHTPTPYFELFGNNSYNYIQPNCLTDFDLSLMYIVNDSFNTYVWNGLTNIATLNNGQPGDFLVAINDLGSLMGTNGNGNIFIQHSSGNRVIFPPQPQGDYMQPYGFNNLAEVVGLDYNTQEGFTLINGVYDEFVFPGASQSSFAGVNDLGDVVGTYNPTPYLGYYAAFLMKNGNFFPINIANALQVTADSVNNSDQVAGSYLSQTTYLNYGYVQDKHGRVTTVDYLGNNMPVAVMGEKAPMLLVSAPVTGTNLTSINNWGQIAGNVTGKYTDGWLYEYVIFNFMGTP